EKQDYRKALHIASWHVRMGEPPVLLKSTSGPSSEPVRRSPCPKRILPQRKFGDPSSDMKVGMKCRILDVLRGYGQVEEASQVSLCDTISTTLVTLRLRFVRTASVL